MTTAEKALFIAANVNRIAAREDAGRCLSDVRWMVDRIEQIVNRPRPKRYAGNCPTPCEGEERCAIPLYAENHDDTQVHCWRCKNTYIIDDLIQAGLDSARGWLFSEREALDIMAQIGKHIPRDHWRNWKQRGVIVNKNEWSAEPRYLLEDIIEAYEERVGKRKARAV